MALTRIPLLVLILVLWSTSALRMIRPHVPRSLLWSVKSSAEYEEAMQLRNSVLKKKLNQASINTRGVFEKEELALLLAEYQINNPASASTSSASVSTASGGIVVAPLVNIYLDPQLQKNYLGVDLSNDRGDTARFIIDTGASMNLIQSSIVGKFGLQSQTSNAYSTGLGGGGTIASQMTHMSNMNLKTTSGSTCKVQNNIPLAILSNPRALPPGSDGLLGLQFLEALPGLVSFDLQSNTMTYGDFAPPSGLSVQKVPFRKITTGLLVCDVYLQVNSQAPVCVTAMIDFGSTYSIANSLAVKALLGDGELNSLPDTNVKCMGIDGRPMTLKSIPVDIVRIGSSDPKNTRAIKPAAGNMPGTLFGASIPGLQQIGLNDMPAMIIGMDVLADGFHKICFDFKDYYGNLYLE